MHIARVGERLPRLQIQFRISRSFRPRNLANLGSKIRFWIRRKEHTLKTVCLLVHPWGGNLYLPRRGATDRASLEVITQALRQPGKKNKGLLESLMFLLNNKTLSNFGKLK